MGPRRAVLYPFKLLGLETRVYKYNYTFLQAMTLGKPSSLLSVSTNRPAATNGGCISRPTSLKLRRLASLSTRIQIADSHSLHARVLAMFMFSEKYRRIRACVAVLLEYKQQRSA
jgi:uncharacterized protein YbbC (DUF1343 family)